MIHKFRHLWQILLTYFILLIGGNIIISHFNIELPQGIYTTLLTVMTIITLAVYMIVMISLKKKEKERGVLLLLAIGGKFLAYLVMILFFWLTAKNLDTEFIIAFFVLYLLLTFLLTRALYKVLKNN